ncbi:MAG: GNAT family N-acetyltransferase [Treponema sp.]|nr:GNAT family N-acetyltransferase [Spirochaetales bacterium]MDY5917533.1 GNAT family N-acetyltransferase [Treponema sp.]MDY6189286.1 GNAT family N-acetyltransferase [Treponema sp.]
MLEELNVDNWLKVMELTVSEEQKDIFPISNVYWVGISRYEEKTTLYAIKNDELYVGMVGIGYDEDGVSGYINPMMIDEKHQGKGYSKEAMLLAIEKLKSEYKVSEIHLGHRKNNMKAGKLYESLGFIIIDEDEMDYFRKLDLNK